MQVGRKWPKPSAVSKDLGSSGECGSGMSPADLPETRKLALDPRRNRWTSQPPASREPAGYSLHFLDCSSIVPRLVLDWCSIGARLVLDWCSIDACRVRLYRALKPAILVAVKRCCILVFLLLGAVLSPAQDDTMTLDEVIQSADQWAKENLNDDTLRALQEVDRAKVKQFFRDLQKQFHGEYVVDLASLNDTARAILPLLEGYEETQPYAAWLKAQLDYLDVADQFRRTTPPPKTEQRLPPK